ncbi:MAG: FG-GAP repeat protein [Pirellulaceae bacterium]|nr:FG-GAP repeat protein [Planctomycetales bacterium]
MKALPLSGILAICFVPAAAVVALPDTFEIAKLVPNDGEEGDDFGSSASLWGNFAIVGAPQKSEGGTYVGAAYLFRRDEGRADSWQQVRKFTSPDGQTDDRFGWSVSLLGDLALVGAHRADAAYLYGRNHGGPDNWGLVKTIRPAEVVGADDHFGISVSLAGDLAIVGASGDDDRGFDAGAAYLFRRDEGGPENWGQVAKFLAADASTGDYLGYSVSLSGDYAVVGARGDDNLRGAAYVFGRNVGGPENWGQAKKLTSPNRSSLDGFGRSVSSAGDLILVGSHNDDTVGQFGGAAYLYDRNRVRPDSWGLSAQLTAADGGEFNNFGWSTFITNELAMVGAIGFSESDDDADLRSGAVYLFKPDEFDGKWIQTNKLIASDGARFGNLGLSASYNDGIAIFGANSNAINPSGAVYIYDLTAAVPEPTAILTATISLLCSASVRCFASNGTGILHCMR